MKKYTKAHLEAIVYAQYENLNAIHDLLKIMRTQNELLDEANKKLKREIEGVKEGLVKYATRGKRRSP